MDYPSFRPGLGEGVDPLVLHLREPAPAGALRLAGHARKGDRLAILLEGGPEGGAGPRWQVRVEGCVDGGFDPGPVSSVSVLRAHPVLWRHARIEMELNVVRAPKEVAALVGALHRVHERVVREAGGGLGVRWVPPAAFLGADGKAESILDGGGILARGPEPLIRAYAEVLDRAGCETMIGSLPGRWGKGRKAPSALRALILGDSFAAGTSFDTRPA